MLAYLAMTPVLVSLLVLFVPGLVLVRWPERVIGLPAVVSRVFLWSITGLILLSLGLAFWGLPPAFSIVLVVMATIVVVFRRGQLSWRKIKLPTNRRKMMTCSLFLLVWLLVFTAYASPFLLIQGGLPSGDAQKAIYWAKHIIEDQQLPPYQLATEELNRDPVDFYTPGLHALVAAVMQATPVVGAVPFYLLTVGFFAIALALAVVIIALAIYQQVVGPKVRPATLLLVPFFILTNFRFLRYLREPGYHLQNIIGELLLFGCLLLLLSLLKQWRPTDLILMTLVVGGLLLSHQFSAFLAAIALLPAGLLLIYHYRREIRRSHLWGRYALAVTGLAVATLLFILVKLDLGKKVAHLFTVHPHLGGLTPPLADYGHLMGWNWTVFGVGGLAAMIYASLKGKSSTGRIAFLAVTTLLLLLSQGPRLYIDIPPVRALFYTVVPLSVTAAYGWQVLADKIKGFNKGGRIFAWLLLVTMTIIPAAMETTKAYNISHQVRVNSTMLAEHWPAIDYVKKYDVGRTAVLVDDYNRRASSWFLLSGRPTYSRLSSDLARAMVEAKQSDLRRKLYLNDLDLEKIYSLGTYPAVTQLMAKHGLGYVTGVKGSSNKALSNNPRLTEVMQGGDLILYRLSTTIEDERRGGVDERQVTKWLLKPTTIVNDIGDDEDTALHLPASLPATRLSDPSYKAGVSWRTSTSPLIPLAFNVNDYVAYLWDQDGSGYPDSSLRLMIRTLDGEKLTVKINDELTVTVSGNGAPVTVPAAYANLKEHDWLVFTILNPEQKPIAIDFIALGLGRVP